MEERPFIELEGVILSAGGASPPESKDLLFSFVILSERSESKDPYTPLTRHSRPPAPPDPFA